MIILLVVGLFVLVAGTFAGILESDILIVVCSVAGGLILVSLWKIWNVLQKIHYRLLGIALTDSQLNTIVKHSGKYAVESDLFDVYPDSNTPYPLLMLDGELYIRARLFRDYVEQEEDRYQFSLPDREPVELKFSDRYVPGAALFGHGDQVFVSVSRLGLTPVFYKDRIRLE
ncbi:MAG: hypothetical protein K0Q94_4303 [Paenibacillus sp.]|uniref:hypothetical protein n=1 Tax=Paenibacillus sp. GCM10012303 TaxID=3317340 RepID=UPI0029F2B4CB|nr:hypothetical protein [Paenibacillus sp.]